MIDVPVLDAHVHVWDPRTTPRETTPAVKLFGFSPRLLAWLAPALFPRAALAFVGDPRYVLAPWTFSDHADGSPASGFVHVEAAWKRRDPRRYAEETLWLESLAEPRLRGIVGHADLAHPDLDALLDAHAAASGRFCGVRDKLAHTDAPGVKSWGPKGKMATAAFRRGFARLGERGLTFDAWCYGHQLDELDALLRDLPATQVVLDHAGTPVGVFDAPERLGPWLEQLERLAQHSQLNVKLSGLLMPVLGAPLVRGDASVGQVVDRIGPVVEHALRVFGPKRCILASNFPMDRVAATASVLWEAFDQLTRGLPDRRGVFGDNAVAFYRLTAPAP